MEKVSILGCGWFGFPFAKALVANGYQVKGSTTKQEKLRQLSDAGIEPFLINTQQGVFDSRFFDCDTLLVNIPPRKSIDDPSVYESDMKAIVWQATLAKVKRLVFIGSTGIFPDTNKVFTEKDTVVADSLAGRKLALAEMVVKTFEIGQVAIVRFGGLIGPDRNLAKFFAGRTAIANGLAPINLLHLDDAIGFCLKLIKQETINGTYHAVAPSHPSRKDFYTALCKSSGMDLPTFKQEFTEGKQVDSLHSFYNYKINNWLNWAGA